MPDAPIETKQSTLAALQKLEAEYKSLDSHRLDYVVTSIASDERDSPTVTHNFYVSITLPKPTATAE